MEIADKMEQPKYRSPRREKASRRPRQRRRRCRRPWSESRFSRPRRHREIKKLPPLRPLENEGKVRDLTDLNDDCLARRNVSGSPIYTRRRWHRQAHEVRRAEPREEGMEREVQTRNVERRAEMPLDRWAIEPLALLDIAAAQCS